MKKRIQVEVEAVTEDDAALAEGVPASRAGNILRENGIITAADVIRHTEAELLRLPNFGRKGLGEVNEWLGGLGLKIGMPIIVPGGET